MVIPIKSYIMNLSGGTITMLLPTNTTGSYIGAVKGLNTNEITLGVSLEVTTSIKKELWHTEFTGVNVLGFQEQVTGSTIRPILQTEAPIVNQRALNSDGITIKLRNIDYIKLDERKKFNVQDYIKFK